ncbi:MAG: hypothetical protein ABI905_17430 [Betaproteobacteria bacterium]
MSIDISTLSVAEIDVLIEHATQRRAQLQPEVSQDWPKGEVQAIFDPRWAATNVSTGTLFQVRHPGHGWLNFVIAPQTRALLVGALTQHALLPQAPQGSPAPAPAPSVGGSTVH